jgi:hypothetical protein
MENRERDRVSLRDSPTEAGGVNRKVEEEKGREHNKGTSAEFGQNIGRSENLEGGNMRNRDDKGMTNIDRSSGSDKSSGSEVNETSRRPGSSYDSSTGRSGSGNKSSGSDRLRDENESKQSDNSGSMGTPKDRHF